MTFGETPPESAEIACYPNLRDKILGFMPPLTKLTKSSVDVRFILEEDSGIELELSYYPEEDLLYIDVNEAVCGPDGETAGVIETSCEIKATTGEVLSYTYDLMNQDEDLQYDPNLYEIENRFMEFCETREEFFMLILGSI